ncbi:hypothetical protein [Lentilactobacillus kosonis]|uniref:Uncharacterized protein n=1 Tax=Lentilactobacillus kosonis TaxID=2810561 RepID=A0A401FJP2_9LACO|nr:hypothetical protein [Lentilactobacillus kosonis]GAY72451.1 hypothetical protein NBRC111893_597 [Lentilactobacillus kosonis]
MTIQTKEQVLPITIGGTDLTDDATTELELSILLGHTTDDESYINQEEPFKKFWDSITPGFKPIVTNDLMTTCSNALTEGLDKILDSTDMNVGDNFYKPDIDWKHIQHLYNISFSNAYSFKDYKPATIEFVDKTNNSNDDKIDISDDDLPF